MFVLFIRLVNVDRMEVFNGYCFFSDRDFGGSCYGSGKIGFVMRSVDIWIFGY